MICCCAVERKDVGKCEELVLNAIATINNLSYYTVDTSAIMKHRLHIAECKINLIVGCYFCN